MFHRSILLRLYFGYPFVFSFLICEVAFLHHELHYSLKPNYKQKKSFGLAFIFPDQGEEDHRRTLQPHHLYQVSSDSCFLISLGFQILEHSLTPPLSLLMSYPYQSKGCQIIRIKCEPYYVEEVFLSSFLLHSRIFHMLRQIIEGLYLLGARQHQFCMECGQHSLEGSLFISCPTAFLFLSLVLSTIYYLSNK